MKMRHPSVATLATFIFATQVRCSSAPSCPAGDICTSNSASSDASADASDVVHQNDEAAVESSNGQSPGSDGTTGLRCAQDSDCVGDSGAGTNRCSDDYQETFYNVTVQVWDPPVCIIPPSNTGNCDPAPASDPNGQSPHFCDGPDDPSSPGVCLPFNPTEPVSGQGLCYPKCTFGTSGSAATGCVAPNACVLWTYLYDSTTSAVTGLGYCQSACQKDSDCQTLGSSYVCETDIGSCTTAKVTRTKSIGAACTTAGSNNDETTGACFCAAGTGADGFCTSTCVSGGAPCPSGWVCDTGEPATLDFGAGVPTVSLTTQTTGMLGTCAQACPAIDAGSANTSDAAPTSETSCPPNSQCSSISIAGPDCTGSTAPDGG
jgi:hypothetical protein